MRHIRNFTLIFFSFLCGILASSITPTIDFQNKANASGDDFICVYCRPEDVMRRINQNTLTNYDFDNALFGENNWSNADISGSSFAYTVFKGLTMIGGTGVNTDFSNSFLAPSSLRASSNFEGAIFANADMRESTLTESSFIDANFTEANLGNSYFNDSVVTEATFTNANLSNVDFTGADLTDAIDIDTATRTGIVWSDTTCPDGTNSDNNSNTCEGHLIP